MLSNFLSPLNGRVVLSLPCCTPDRDHLGTPRPPLRLHTHLPNTNASAHHPTLAHEPLPSPRTAIRRPLQLPIAAVHPAPPTPLPPLRTQAFPSTRCGSGPPYIKANVGGEEISVRFGGSYGEEATGRPSHWVFGGLISLPTALGVRVLWLRKGRKKREWG